MQSTVTYTNSKHDENIPKGFSYIWAQTLKQGIYFLPAQIISVIKILYFHPNNRWRLHLVYVEIDGPKSGLGLFLPNLAD